MDDQKTDREGGVSHRTEIHAGLRWGYIGCGLFFGFCLVRVLQVRAEVGPILTILLATVFGVPAACLIAIGTLARRDRFVIRRK
jgi:hypothetical protein